jgi:hypothetical protein
VIKANEIFTFSLKGRTLHSLMVFSQTQTRQAAQAPVLKGYKAVKRAWISLLYRRVQKIELIQPDQSAIYQKNHNKRCN